VKGAPPVKDPNKRNLQYFEASTMAGLYDALETWQLEHEKRFLSLNVQSDNGKFCCIALTNPTEVVIMDKYGKHAVNVSLGKLEVRT
jgi:hypothetical protein